MKIEDDPAELARGLREADDAALDALPFGAIGIDAEGRVTRYSRWESELSGLPPDTVIGKKLFVAVAPCLAHRTVSDWLAGSEPVDVELDWVFTTRMQPTPVRLRLLRAPGQTGAWVLVRRR